MRKILTCLMAMVIGLGLFTFAFAETNVTKDKTDSINIIQTESPPVVPTVNNFTRDFVEAKAVYQGENSADDSTTLEPVETIQILNNQKINPLNNQIETTFYSPPDSNRERFEPTTNGKPDKNLLKPNFELVKSRHLVQRE